MKVIPLTRNKFAIIDNEDFERVSQHKWSCMNHGTAQARIGKTRVQMHRFILDAKPGQIIDHINHDTLDNRRSNLRFVTQSQNCFNRKRNKAGYKGVYAQPEYSRRNPYFSTIFADGKKYYLGRFSTAEDAARAYDRKAIELHGEFACLNFPLKNLSRSSTKSVDTGSLIV